MDSKDTSKGIIRGFLTNLGKYVEGELVGRWVSFPISEADFEEAMKGIGIGEPDDFGNPYEETFWTDWETDIDGFDAAKALGEHARFEKVNALAQALEQLSCEELKMLATLNRWGGNVYCNLANIINGNVWYANENSWSNLARREVGEYGGVEALSRDTLERYLDFEALGRDMSFDGMWTIDSVAVYVGDYDESLALDGLVEKNIDILFKLWLYRSAGSGRLDLANRR